MIPKLAISLINHSNPELLLDCLMSIHASGSAHTFDIWVVDNATDLRLVHEMQALFPCVRWLFNSSRLGFAANHNQILSQMRSEYICILNDDTVVHMDCFETLVDYLDSSPDVGVVGPKLLNPDGTLQISAFREADLFQEAIDVLFLPRFLVFLKARHVHRGQYFTDPAIVDHLKGACMLFRRVALDYIGLLDAQMSPIANMEDLDICRRMRIGGWKVVFHPAASVVHIGGQSVHGEKIWLEFMRLRLAYRRKHFGIMNYFGARLIHIGAAFWNSLMVIQAGFRGRSNGSVITGSIGSFWRAAFQPVERSER